MRKTRSRRALRAAQLAIALLLGGCAEATPSGQADPGDCGDGVCDGGENAETCPSDCPVVVGDGVCTPPENAASAPVDCPASSGDGVCSHSETCTTEPGDCGACPVLCGDGVCDAGEDASSCAGDCPARSGDGVCTHGETCETESGDCGECPANCGDSVCDDGENASSCPADCPAVPGDGFCTEGEDASTTPQDCPAADGDGLCTHGESCATTPRDCGECAADQCATAGECIPFGHTWRYDDSDTDHRLAWTTPGFDDSSWATGPAELGFGDDDEATVLDNNGPSYYFRTSFTLDQRPNAAALSVLFDDGVAVFLNGAEVFRDNLNNGLDHDVFGGSAGKTDLERVELSEADFVVGANVIAVVVKNGSADSSDVSFDLSLTLGN